MQGNPPYFRDIDNDNDLDLVFDSFPWNGGSNGIDIMAFINDGEKTKTNTFYWRILILNRHKASCKAKEVNY